MSEASENSFEPILQQLLTVRGGLEVLREQVRRSHPDWAVAGDARATTFAKLANTLRATELSLGFLARELGDAEWWATRRPESLPSGQFRFEFSAYSQFAKGGLLQFAFSAMDSGFRLYLRALDPVACRGATSEFRSIAECLLLSHLGIGRGDLVLLDLMRLVRNLIHSEGVYVHQREPLVRIEYGGATYEFVQGQPIDFATWPFVIQLVEDEIGLIQRVISHQRLAGVTAAILDPACESAPWLV